MQSQIIRVTLTLLAVFGPITAARITFNRRWNEWFSKKQNSWFSIGWPSGPEGYIVLIATLIMTITLLILANKYSLGG